MLSNVIIIPIKSGTKVKPPPKATVLSPCAAAKSPIHGIAFAIALLQSEIIELSERILLRIFVIYGS